MFYTCLSFCSQGGCVFRHAMGRGMCPHPQANTLTRVDTHPLQIPPLGRHPAGQTVPPPTRADTAPPPRRPLKRAVLRILLECILILQVQTPDVSKLQKTYTTHSLVITYKYMYIVREDYILWPQPTFGIGPSTRPQFEIIHSLPVSGRISGIQVFVSVYLSQKMYQICNPLRDTSSE